MTSRYMVTLMLFAAAAATGFGADEVASTNAVAAVEDLVPTPPKMVCTAALRNPFWMIGYEGELESITDGSDEAQTAAAAAAAEAAALERAAIRRSRGGNDDDPKVQAQRWREAQELIHVGGVTTALVDGDERRVININARSYFIGDYVVAKNATHRFVWQVVNFDDVGSLSLARIQYTSLKAEAEGK